jgi:hypothetical protein
MSRKEVVDTRSTDHWFKIVEFLQQNWALIDDVDGGVIVWFFGDTAGVFDSLHFATRKDAEQALRRNGFARYATDPKAHSFIAIPEPPFWRDSDWPIYSSGRFWK